MKKATFTVALCCIALTSSAQNQELSSNAVTEIKASDDAKKELVATREGIEISYSTTMQDQNAMLDMEFTNTTENSISFTWSVEAKIGLNYKSQNTITLKAGKSIKVKNTLELKGSMDYASYPVKLTIN